VTCSLPAEQGHGGRDSPRQCVNVGRAQTVVVHDDEGAAVVSDDSDEVMQL
jgi:hypothetical protein